jgi:iron complex outermembrane recepter protein
MPIYRTACSVLAIMAATPALGQAAPAADAKPAATAPVGIQEIVVTAQRRSENLQKAALAVSAVNGSQLVKADITETGNLTKLVPSLVVQPSGGGSNVNFYLRGVGTVGTNAFSENAISFNVDGVYIGRPTGAAGVFYDVQRVEVLRGPQGTLYGRNATGGAVTVIPNRPELDRVSADVAVEYGNYDSKKANAAVNLPLGSNLALRVAGQVVDRNGYLSDGYDDEKGQAARAELLFKPSSAFSLLVTGDYYHQGGKGNGSVLLPYVDPSDKRLGGSDPAEIAALEKQVPLAATGLVSKPADNGYVDSTFYGFSATAEIDLGFGTVTLIPAWRKSKPDYVSYLPGFYSYVDEDTDQTSVELRLASKADRSLRYVVGAYYFRQTQDATNVFDLGLLSTAVFYPHLVTNSKAVFGQATYDLSGRLRLVGGLRYTSEDKSQDTPFANETITNRNPALVVAVGSRTDNGVTWKAGFEFDAAPRSLVYANVATGFKAGGFYQSLGTNSYAPEHITAWTVGTKNRFLGNRLQLNAEAFYWKYTDQQINYIGPIQTAPGVYGQASLTANVGTSRMYGTEVEAQFMPTRDDLMSADIQYLNAKYTSFDYLAISTTGAAPAVGCAYTANTSLTVTAPTKLYNVNCSGMPAINAPKWTVNLAYEHTFHLDDYKLMPGVRSRIESSRYLKPDFLAMERQGADTIEDVYLTLEAPDGKWTLTGFVNNVGNATVLSTVTLKPIANVLYAGLRPPRTYGVRAAVKF